MPNGTGTIRSYRADAAPNNGGRARSRQREAWAALMVGALILHGCAAPGKRLESPHISISRIAIESATIFEMEMSVVLRILNTNEVPLTLKGADVTLEVNGKDFAHGVSRIETILPAYDAAMVPMTLYSSMIPMVKGLLKLRKQSSLHYRVYGKVRIEGGFLMPGSLPFSSSGELPLDKARPRD
jgi:LEA14-like dessication related protein